MTLSYLEQFCRVRSVCGRFGGGGLRSKPGLIPFESAITMFITSLALCNTEKIPENGISIGMKLSNNRRAMGLDYAMKFARWQHYTMSSICC